MREIKRAIALICTLSILTACQATPRTLFNLPYEGGVVTLQYEWLEAPFYWQQHAIVEFDATRQELILTTHIQRNERLMVALSPAGQELFRVHISERGIDVRGAERLPDHRLPLRMLAELQLTITPTAQLVGSLHKLFIEEQVQPEWKREMKNSDGENILVLRADALPLQAEIIQIQHEYFQITLTTLDIEFTEHGDE